ncbi:MAG TPA: IS200/IS605 family transposase, partial [Coleofasciculaceae cyanobacterium]
MTQYRRGRHSVTLIHAHLVFVTKYRKKVFKLEHIQRLEEVCNHVASTMNFRVIRLNGESDHVHLLIEYPPKLSISQIVNSLKGVSSRMLRKEFKL